VPRILPSTTRAREPVSIRIAVTELERDTCVHEGPD
jgi:hypothetical protein